MSAGRYTPLLRDGVTIARTLRETYGAARPREAWRDEAGGTVRAVQGVHPALTEVEVVEVIEETAHTRTLLLKACDGILPAHLPGQYVNVFVELDGVHTSRPLSISSLPGEPLRVTVKRTPGGFVSPFLVDRLEVGQRLHISGPEGDFHHLPFRDGDDLVFIAGGSGITPMAPMIERLLARRPDARVHLIYGSVDPDQIIFRRRLEELARQHEALSVTLTVDRDQDGWGGRSGYVDATLLDDALGGDLSGKTFFICGPAAMERAVLQALERLGVPRSRVRVELSGPPADPTTLPGWPAERSPDEQVTLTLADGLSVLARAGEPLLNSLERAGLKVPAICRSGCCGSCRTKVEQGDLVQASPGRPSDADAGYVNACVSYPVSDATLRVPGQGVQRPLADLPVPRETPVEGAPAAAQAEDAPPRSAGKVWLGFALALGGLAVFLYFMAEMMWVGRT